MKSIFYVKGKKYGCDIGIVDRYELKVIPTSYKATEFIERLAELYLRPAKESFQFIGKNFDYSQKIPILIENHQFLFFPTISMKDKECCWINYYFIYQIKRTPLGTKIYFRETSNKLMLVLKTYPIEFEMDKRIFTNQMKRCNEIHQQYNQQNVQLDQLLHSKTISQKRR